MSISKNWDLKLLNVNFVTKCLFSFRKCWVKKDLILSIKLCGTFWENLKKNPIFSSDKCYFLHHKNELPKYSTQEAKPSFSHKSSHHSGVTKLPNHWWANSWEITALTPRWSLIVLVDELKSNADSRYVIRPQFSMALHIQFIFVIIKQNN